MTTKGIVVRLTEPESRRLAVMAARNDKSKQEMAETVLKNWLRKVRI